MGRRSLRSQEDGKTGSFLGDDKKANPFPPSRLPVQALGFFRPMFVFAALASCGRNKHPSGDSQEAPAPSVITLGVSLGSCEDLASCERECDAGSADRCRRLAVSYALGQGAEKDETRATGLYEKACSMGDPSACVFAGQMHEYAHGVPKDEQAAAHLYDVACERGWPPGCYNRAFLYENAHTLTRDHRKAAELYQVACKAGATQACDRAKDIFEALDAAPSGSDKRP